MAGDAAQLATQLPPSLCRWDPLARRPGAANPLTRPPAWHRPPGRRPPQTQTPAPPLGGALPAVPRHRRPPPPHGFLLLWGGGVASPHRPNTLPPTAFRAVSGLTHICSRASAAADVASGPTWRNAPLPHPHQAQDVLLKASFP